MTLFHTLALILVMGLATDTVVFYLELGFNFHTWFAGTLSFFTTLLAFGMLSFSQVPLLAQFGSIVMSGLVSIWLLAPVFYLLIHRRQEGQLHAAH